MTNTTAAPSTAAPIEVHPSVYRNSHTKLVDLFVKSETATFRLHINHGTAQNSSLRAWLNENHPGHILVDWGFWADVEEDDSQQLFRVEHVRTEHGVIIACFGDIENVRQTVTLWVDARRTDDEGFTEQEIIKLTVPLTGPVKPLIEKYLAFALPGYEIHDWQTWEETEKPEPLSGLTALVELMEVA